MSTELATPEAPAAPIVATPETAAPAAVAPVTPAAEPTSLSANDRLDLSPTQRRELLFQQKATPDVAPAPAAPTPEPTAASVEPAAVAPTTPPAAAVEPAVTPAEDEDAGQAGITKNFRIHTDDPKESAFFKAWKIAKQANRDVTPIEVARIVGYEMPGAPATGQAPNIPGVVGQPQVPAEITAAREEIAAMEAALDSEFPEGTLMTPEVRRRHAEIAAKQRALDRMELRHELDSARQAEIAESNAQTTREAEMQAVETEYPSLSDPESDLSLELDRQFGFITSNPEHPDFQKVNQPGFPDYIAKQAATVVVARAMKKNPGMTEAQALAAAKGKPITAAAPVSPAVVTPPAKQTQTQPVPRTVLVTAPGGQAAPAPVQLNTEQALEAARRDPNVRKAALFGSGERIVA